MQITSTRNKNIPAPMMAITLSLVSRRFSTSSNVSSLYIDNLYLCLNFSQKDFFSAVFSAIFHGFTGKDIKKFCSSVVRKFSSYAVMQLCSLLEKYLELW